MSFKNKIRTKQQRKSDRRRKERKRLKRLRIKKADEKKKLRISGFYALEKPKLPERIVVEEVVKNGGTEGTISVNFNEEVYSVDVKNISPKKVVYSIDAGREKCAPLEGFSKIMSLNRERITSILASAI